MKTERMIELAAGAKWLHGEGLTFNDANELAAFGNAIIDEATAALRAENAELVKKLAAYEAQPDEPYSWKHNCNVLCMNDVELWVDTCPHCGKPRTVNAKPTDTTHLEAVKRKARAEGMERAAVIAAGYEPDFDGPIETAIRAAIKDKP